ncbi:MAG TPA: hypothetical protein VK835_13855 [Bacteroidia bacterium]|nr:hypothetical protein [Bacteroidia bacterium]
MIKKLLALVAILVSSLSFAQNDIDAMRYSQTSSYGDARFMAMGGAFGSLGANVSCINFNPAGIAMYRKGELVVTPGLQFQAADAAHYGTSSSDFSTKLSLSNLGLVAAWDQKPMSMQTNNGYQPYNGDRYGPGSNKPTQTQQPKPTQSIPDRWAFCIDFNRVVDFNYHTTISGIVPAASSITSDMAGRANGNSTTNLDQFNEGLFYQQGLITPYTNSNTMAFDSTGTHYAPLAVYDPPNTMFQQTKTIQSSGRVGELGLALAHSFHDRFYFGGSIGVPFVKYNYQSTLTESDYKNMDSYFSTLSFQENVVTSGVGINAKIGGIYRFNSGVKVGVYGQTPTDYKLNDNYQNTLNATYDGSYSQYNGSISSPSGTYAYKFHTPARGGASVSYVFKKLLAFSVDGEYVDYATARYPNNIDFFDANATIRQKYKGTANIKAGIELNVRPVVLRAGFGSYGSPFGDVLSGKFVRNSFSGGVGFRGTHNVYLDLGFIYTRWADKYYVIDPMYVQPSNINYSTLYITATLGIKFN